MALRREALERVVSLLEKGEWQAAHAIVQQDEDSTAACWAHGIVHLMEGDTGNARYWYRAAKRPFPVRPDPAGEVAALKAALAESGL